jgi:hypothetical protein
VGLVICPVAAGQQWTAIRLHPEGASHSAIYALSPGKQGGEAASFPGYWAGGPDTWTPLAYQSGRVYGMDAGTQVGEVAGHAVLWNGTLESRIELLPGTFSECYAVRGTMQVGAAYVNDHAATWNGTPASFMDLHPAGAQFSVAYATDGLLQGGAAFVPFGQSTSARASIWNGTPQSWIDLHPLTLRTSYVYGMVPGIQVGEAFDGLVNRASMWRGTQASWIDLTPPGQAGFWRLYCTNGRYHAGDGTESGFARAFACFGTPQSWLNLHQYLPPQYTTWSIARAILQEGPTIYIGGSAWNASSEQEAVLWIGQDPCYPNCDQSAAPPILNVADFTCFITRFAARDSYANCDGSTGAPTLNVADFTCFLSRFVSGCP